MSKRTKAAESPVPTQDLRKAADAAFQCNSWDEVIELYSALLSAETTPDGEAVFRLGYAYDEKGEYDKAIECYQKAVDTPGYDTLGTAWYNMGLAYALKGEHDKAIECFQKAIDAPGYDTPGRAWNSMGVAYHYKGEYDKAIECYQKALDTPGFDAPGRAWFNLGCAWGAKLGHAKAIEFYQKAVDTPAYDKPGHAWFNMGLAYRLKGDLAGALRAFEKAARAYRKAGAKPDEDDALAQAELVRVSQQVGTKTAADLFPALSAATSQGAEPDPYDPLKELQALERRAQLESKGYSQRYQKRRKDALPISALAILKGWSSSEPFVTSGFAEHSSLPGGGLFVRWNGKGVVLDPGIDYLSNFHKSGFFVQDIDAMVVTHNHEDHTFDLPAINDTVRLMQSFEPKGRARYCFLSEPVRNQFGSRLRQTAGYTFAAPYERGIQGVGNPRLHPCIPGIQLVPFDTKHAEHSFGLKLHLDRDGNEMVIGITSDTKYFKGLLKHLKDAHVIVAHISNPDSEEYRNPHFLKAKAEHLGLNGTRKLIEGTNADVYVISEFWAGLGDRRVPLCQKLAYDLKRVSGIEGKCIIPADVGLMIHLDFGKDGKPMFSLKCTSCDNPVQCCDVTVVRPDEPYGTIRYICPDCMSRLTLPTRWASPSSSLPGLGRSRPGESSGE